MPEPEQREFMTYTQADAIYAVFQRFLRSEISISDLMASELTAWNRGKQPYPLYVPPGWTPDRKAKGAGA